ncbi:hypothetical protein CFP56_041883 [Quercus suber]|uniref:Uncharacterized protein n=1 Tax=Quercus suber TaxID=58331 RepID=A0AAW0LLR2_QUESU
MTDSHTLSTEEQEELFTASNPSTGVEPNREAKRKLSPPRQLSQAQVASSIRSLRPSGFQQAHKSLTKSPEVSKWSDEQSRAELEVRPTKLKQNASVKGKKATARTRASQSSSSNAAREELVQFTPQKLEKANKMQTLPNPSCEGASKQALPKPSCDGASKQEGEGLARPRIPNDLQISSWSGSAMGNQRGSDGCGAAGGSDSCNPSKTGSGEALVQREALEEGADSAVAGLNRYTFTGGGASRDCSSFATRQNIAI